MIVTHVPDTQLFIRAHLSVPGKPSLSLLIAVKSGENLKLLFPLPSTFLKHEPYTALWKSVIWMGQR